MKRRKKRASNKTEEAILSREQTRRERERGEEEERICKEKKDAEVYRLRGGKEPCAGNRVVVVDIMREE